MSWQEEQRKGWGGEWEQAGVGGEIINGSRVLAFDQVVWSEVSSQEMK